MVMKVVEVIPVSRGIFKERLSYFTSLPLKEGDLVDAPVKNRAVPALVTRVTEASDIKLELKKADFELKKIEELKRRNFVSPVFIEAARAYSDYLVAPLGSILKQFIPQAILNSVALGTEKSDESLSGSGALANILPDRVAVQESDNERLAYYRSLIREAFAQNKSVMICVPTIPLASRIKERLERGILNYVGILHSSLSAKAIVAEWQRLAGLDHPIVAIVTPVFISLPRLDWQTIIIERENSSGYRALGRPFADVRKFAEIYTTKLKIKLIFGDSVLRVETAKLYGGKHQHLVPLRQHALSSAKVSLVDMGQEVNDRSPTSLISEDLANLLDRSYRGGEKLFLYAHRRGLSPVVVCQDCGSPYACPECGAMMVLHGDHVFLCHRCGYGEKAEIECRSCGGWRLKELGFGIEQIEKSLRAISPDYNIYRLDSDVAKTPAQAQKIVKKFLATTGGILLGTEMALYYLPDQVENVAAVALDGLFTLPDFRVNERVFNLLVRLRAQATKHFLVQTRRPDHQLFFYAIRGQISDFHREEIASRREFGYPPFRLLIKISRRGDKTEVLTEINRLAQDLREYEPTVYRASGEPKKGDYQLNILLKLLPNAWPEADLFRRLKVLPPQFLIEVEPASIF